MTVSGPMDLLRELDRLEALRDSKQADKREFQRFLVRAEADLLPMDPATAQRETVEIKIRDISRAGVGFVCQQPLPVNSTWHMRFLRDGYMIGQQGVMIRHCRAVEEGVYLVGGQFCIDTGMLLLLGVEPRDLEDEDGSSHSASNSKGSFHSPEELDASE